MDQICRLCNQEVSDVINLFSEDSIKRFESGLVDTDSGGHQ